MTTQSLSAQISVIITVYNRERYLAAAIDSVLAQTYEHFELLIWDDGSTDGSLAIAQKYAQQDTRITVVDSPHLGVSRGLRKAIASTTAPYLCWVDSDDMLAPTALANTLAVLQKHKDVGMVYTNYTTIGPNGEKQGLGKRCQIPYSKDRLLIDFMTFHFRLLRRSAYEQAGGINPKFSAAVDYDLCLRLSEVTNIHHLHKSLYFYRHHGQSISAQSTQKQTSFSAKAIRLAIARRGLDSRYELSVEPPSAEKYASSSKFRLKRKRRIGPKVLGIGLGRTGTTSLCEALKMLGYDTLHLPKQLETIDFYDAAADSPVAIAYKALDDRYPGSKFILTTRDTDSWLASWRSHDQRVQQMFNNSLPAWLVDMRETVFGQAAFNTDVWRKVYEQHTADVLSHFQHRSQDIVQLTIGAEDNWQQLCTFLEKPVPDDPFPHKNKSLPHAL